MKKKFPTTGVGGVYTGVCLNGFEEIHDVFDHLFPGIMTIGVAMMAETARAEVLRQYPGFKKLGPCDGSNYQEWTKKCVERFGPKMELEGPMPAAFPPVEPAEIK